MVKVVTSGILTRVPTPYGVSRACVQTQDKRLYSHIIEDLEQNREALAELSEVVAREGVERSKGYFSAKLGPDDDPASGVIQILVNTSNILPPEIW